MKANVFQCPSLWVTNTEVSSVQWTLHGYVPHVPFAAFWFDYQQFRRPFLAAVVSDHKALHHRRRMLGCTAANRIYLLTIVCK